ncbi:MAG: hypothetical protein AAB639_03445 [Patescibacteria group bacterium]
MIKRFANLWPLALLLLATFITRIVKLEDLFYFTYDESVFAFVGRRMALWHHIPLIGGATPLGVHVAPYFYWFFALTLIVGKLNPLFWGYIAAALAVATTFMMYKVGILIDSKKVGITAAILWAFSYMANVYDRHFWGLTFGPLFSLLVIYSLYKIKRGNQKFIYVLGLILAFVIHADLSYYVFLVLAVVAWIIFKLPLNKKTLVALAIILSSFIPLVIFDLRHNFANTKPVLEFIQAGRNNPGFESQKFIDNSLLFPRTLTRLVYTFGDNQIAKQYSYCVSYVLEKFRAIPWYLVVLSSVILIAFVIKHLRGSPVNSARVGFRLIALLLVLYFFGIQLYGTIFRADIFEHYITGILAAFLLILAKVVSYLPKNLWLVFLAIFVTVNLYKLLNTQNSQGLETKRLAIEYTMQQVGGKPFSLDSLSTCWKYNGYRYLFTVFGREPVKSYVDPSFAYLYGTTPVAEKHPATVVAFVVHDFAPETEEFYRRYALLKSHEIKSTIFGVVEVIIMDNSTGWFD